MEDGDIAEGIASIVMQGNAIHTGPCPDCFTDRRLRQGEQWPQRHLCPSRIAKGDLGRC